MWLCKMSIHWWIIVYIPHTFALSFTSDTSALERVWASLHSFDNVTAGDLFRLLIDQYSNKRWVEINGMLPTKVDG